MRLADQLLQEASGYRDAYCYDKMPIRPVFDFIAESIILGLRNVLKLNAEQALFVYQSQWTRHSFRDQYEPEIATILTQMISRGGGDARRQIVMLVAESMNPRTRQWVMQMLKDHFKPDQAPPPPA